MKGDLENRMSKQGKNDQKWTYGYTKEEYKRFNFNGILFLVLFSFLYCCLYCMRQNITYGGQYIAEGLSWSTSDIGIDGSLAPADSDIEYIVIS